MTGWQLLWLAAADTVLLFLALGAYEEFMETRDPIDIRWMAGFIGLAALSIPLFAL